MIAHHRVGVVATGHEALRREAPSRGRLAGILRWVLNAHAETVVPHGVVREFNRSEAAQNEDADTVVLGDVVANAVVCPALDADRPAVAVRVVVPDVAPIGHYVNRAGGVLLGAGDVEALDRHAVRRDRDPVAAGVAGSEANDALALEGEVGLVDHDVLGVVPGADEDRFPGKAAAMAPLIVPWTGTPDTHGPPALSTTRLAAAAGTATSRPASARTSVLIRMVLSFWPDVVWFVREGAGARSHRRPPSDDQSQAPAGISVVQELFRKV